MSVKNLQDTIDWYNSNAEQYAEVGVLNLDMSHIYRFRQELSSGASVLDAGCGFGRDANILHMNGLKVTGLDLSLGLLKVAKQNYPNLDFVEGNLLSLPFDDGSFDGVWSNVSLVHLETVHDVKQALGEMCRVLKPGGVVHLLVKSQTGDHKTAVVADKLSGHDRFFQYFKPQEMTDLLEATGFNILHSKEYSETETIPHGRPEVRLIWCLARKS